MQDARTKTDCNKQSKNEINTKNQSRKLNGNPNHCYIKFTQGKISEIVHTFF